MSLESCIKQMGKALSKQDADAILALRDAGLGDLEAIDAYLNEMDQRLAGSPQGSPGTFQPAVDTAKAYMESVGRPYQPPLQYAPPVDVARAERIADEYALMEHAPHDPLTKASYDAMIEETIAQFEVILDTGLEIEFIRGDDPYGNPNEMTADVRDNNHMWVFPTEDGFGSDSTFDVSENPLLRETDFVIDGHKLLANDVFRIVHDYFGHVAHGAGFRARGEEHAWQSHASMYSPLARRAMTTETRGQNSWVNFGPYGETNRTATTEDTVFADQKIGLLPIWVSEDGRLSAHERRQRFEDNRQANRTGFEGAIDETGRVELVHYSRDELQRVDPSRWGTGLSRRVRSEANRRAAGAPGRVYFGIESANANPYRKESGLGNRRLVTHVPGELIYDLVEDPENLRASGDVAATERAILEAGYMGYYRDHPQLGKVVAIYDEVPVAATTTLYQGPANKHGVPVKYTVKSRGKVTGKSSVIKVINPRNVEKQSEALATLAESNPDPLASEAAWLRFERALLGDNQTPRPPYKMIQQAGDIDQWANEFGQLTEEQRIAAGEGFAGVDAMRDLYESGDATVHTTGKLMLWGMMSRMLSAHPHESAFLDAAVDAKLDEFIERAVEREWTQEDVDEYLEWAGQVIPDFAPGKQGTSNLNDFGKVFLKKMSQRNDAGESKLMELHEMIADHSIPSAEVRRAYYGLNEGMGIQNKVLSFTMLMTGRTDVVVLDRIQINTMWDAGRYGKLIYDDVATLFEGAHGLARYEALERSLLARVDELYEKVGRGDEASVGRYHWESWVLNSGQVVSHPTMQGLINETKGELPAPYADIGAPEGRFHAYAFGSIYARDADGTPYMIYPTQDGTPYRFTLSGFKDLMKEFKKPSNKVTPRSFSVSIYREQGYPWYEAEGVDRDKIDEITKALSEGEVSSEAVVQEPTPDVAGSQPTQFEQERRASIELRENNQRLIRLGQASDPSSFLHESAHLFLELEKQLAREFGIRPEQQAVLDWLGVESFDDIDTEMHEKYAETFEVYLETGKAPSLGLRDAFAAFRRWLTRIYNSLDPRERADLTPEITEYFDRLLASEAEIEQMQGNPAFDQFFRSKEQAGMTDAQWAKYQEQKQRAEDAAVNELDQKLINELTRRAKADWKEEKEPMVEEELERLKKQPVYAILADTVADKMDYDAVKELNGGKIPGNMIGKAKKGGIDPDEYAEVYGFPSAAEMIKAIVATPPIRKAADEAAEARMVAKHGDILNDGSIELEAREAMHNEEQAKLLLTELKALDKTTKLDRAYLQAEAKRMIGSMKYAEIKPGKYYRAEIRAAKRAAEAKTPEEAFQAKAQQAANHYLYRESLLVKEAMDRQRKYIRRVQTRKYSAKQVENKYIQQLKVIANMYELRTNPERVAAAKGVIEWFATQLSDDNQYVDVSLVDINILGAMNAREISPDNEVPADFALPTFDDLTAEGLRSVYDQLRHLRFIGGQRAELTAQEKAAKRDALTQSILDNGGRDDKGTPGVPRQHESLLRSFSSFFHSLSSLRNMVRTLDGNFDDELGGTAHDIIYKEVEDATNRMVQLKHDMYQTYETIFGDVHGAGLSRRDGKTYILEDGSTKTFHSESRFMMALYWGTETSRDAIREGFNLTDNDVNKILSDLTPRQIDLVNAAWVVNETMWPDLSAASVRLYGVAPPKLDAVPFTINGVQMTGGHMRLFYDSSNLELKTEQAQQGSQSSVMPNKAGSLHARIGSGGRAPALDLSNIIVALDESIHFIAWAETGNHLHGLIDSDDVVAAMEKKHGVGFSKTLIDNVDAKTGNRGARETVPFFSKVAKLGRRSVTMAYLAYSIKDTVAAVGTMPFVLDQVGGKAWVSNAVKFISGDRAALVEEIHGKSVYMRDRAQFINREATEYLNRMTTSGKIPAYWQKFQELGFVPQTFMDSLMAYPAWLAAYEEAAKDQGLSETDIIRIADSAVAESLGSGGDLHLGGLFQSNQNEWVKLFTTFGSWFNMIYNRIYKASEGFTNVRRKEVLTSAIIAPFASAMINAAITFSGPDLDDDEGWLEWMVSEYFRFMASAVPIIRGMASSLEGRKPTTVLADVQDIPGNTAKAVATLLDDEKSGVKRTSTAIKAVNKFVPLPGSGNLTRLLDYMDVYDQGKVEGDFNLLEGTIRGSQAAN